LAQVLGQVDIAFSSVHAELTQVPMEVAMMFPMFEWVVCGGEHLKVVAAVWIVLICAVRPKLRMPVILSLPCFIVFMISYAVYESRVLARQEGYDLTLPSIRDKLETYIETGEGGTPAEIISSRKYAPTLGYWEMSRYLGTSFFEFASHTTNQDFANVHEGYNKGHDWFEATLGEPMFYSSGFFLEQFGDGDEPLEFGNPDKFIYKEALETAQLRKMEYIINALGVKPGMKALDIGSGWGRFVEYLAQKGAEVTGVVAAHDLVHYARRLNKHHGNKVKFIAQNFFDVKLPEKSFDVISAVEMSEHAGLANFNVFLKKIISLLKDQGTFYIQCSGLQRGYAATNYNNYNELIWGLFMEQHVFPGADSSTPLGWIVEHMERAGFEVQSAQNMGISYMRTLHAWQRVWESKKDEISRIYGEKAWRRWYVFLAWCVGGPSRTGGSTVNFITATKSGAFTARYDAQYRLAPGRWVSPSDKELGTLAPRQGDGSFIEKCNAGGYNTSGLPCKLGLDV